MGEKLIKCEACLDTFIASDKTLPIVLEMLLGCDKLIITKILRCDKNGWHIFVKEASP